MFVSVWPQAEACHVTFSGAGGVATGPVRTYLPTDGDASRLGDFREGGKLRALPAEMNIKLIYADGSGALLVPVPNTNQELAGRIRSFLHARGDHICVLEDSHADAEFPYVKELPTKRLIVGRDVHHMLDQLNGELEEIEMTIQRASDFVAVLTCGHSFGARLRHGGDEEVGGFAEHAESVIVPVYDGEADLFWTRAMGRP